jgi:RHS repeat-associated protein
MEGHRSDGQRHRSRKLVSVSLIGLPDHSLRNWQKGRYIMDNHKKQQTRKSMSALLRWFALSLLFVGAHAFAQTGGTVTYVYTDPQGTPLAETDASGNITATFEYTPYGTYAPQGTSAPGPTPNGPGYTGHVNDPETNLVYMQARYYDPVTGRFLSVDPIASSSGNVFNFNRFKYANNNPIVNTDPDGRQEEGRVETDVIESIQNARTLRPMPPAAGTPSLPPEIDPVVITEATRTQSLGEAMSNLDKAGDKILEASQERQEQQKNDADPTSRGVIYLVDGNKTSSGRDYVGSTDDLTQREKDRSDGRDRSGAQIIDTYERGNREERRQKEQKAINGNGGRDRLDNKRNEIAPHKWDQNNIPPPPPPPSPQR